MVLLALATLLVGAAPAAAAERRVPQGWLGVQADGALLTAGPALAGEWGRMAGAGVESVRIAFYWDSAQPAADRAPDLSRFDERVALAARNRLRVVPVVFRTPDWARQVPTASSSPPAADAYAAYAAFVAALARRYGPRGSLWRERPDLPRVPIREWQLWNEPNLDIYWSVQPWARDYVRLLRRGDRALKRVDPRATTVLAGLPNDSPAALRQIYAAGGRGAFDAVAVHPYTRRPADVVRLVERNRQVMARAGDRRLPVWLTEVSYTSAGSAVARLRNPIGIETTERGQATRLTEVIGRLADARRRLRIERVIWYTWLSADGGANDVLGGSLETFDYAGLRRLRRGAVNDVPALAAYRRVARRLEGCAKAPNNAARCR